MNLIHNTLSVCEHCYRHVDASVYEQDNRIWIDKQCPEHGKATHCVESDADFYLNYKYPKHALGSYFIEVTNRCNLNCPHCYQQPNLSSTDPTIDEILDLISKWPDDGKPVALVGAEPTMRSDLNEVITAIQNMPGEQRSIMILTNGVHLANFEYAKKFKDLKNVAWTFGLNHPDYQGIVVRNKQMNGISNLKRLQIPIKNVSYTLEDMTQLEYCLNEIQEFGNNVCQQFRVRCGADIGRHPGGEKIFLSDLVKQTMKICKENNWKVVEEYTLSNRAHFSLLINDLLVKIIQWPDAKTLDLKEVQTEAIADILPGKPPSPLVHQVILRDGAINKGLPLHDTIPQEWIDNYGN